MPPFCVIQGVHKFPKFLDIGLRRMITSRICGEFGHIYDIKTLSFLDRLCFSSLARIFVSIAVFLHTSSCSPVILSTRRGCKTQSLPFSASIAETPLLTSCASRHFCILLGGSSRFSRRIGIIRLRIISLLDGVSAAADHWNFFSGRFLPL